MAPLTSHSIANSALLWRPAEIINDQLPVLFSLINRYYFQINALKLQPKLFSLNFFFPNFQIENCSEKLVQILIAFS